MAQKRMFSKTITNSDNFLELPDSSQVLYFHLSMNADDDGFINNWKSILKMTGTKEDDLYNLIRKSFVIPFETGVIVIKHWRLNNYLQGDRKKPTVFQEEIKKLDISKGGEYFLKEIPINKGLEAFCIHSIDKNSIDKNSIDIYSRENLDNVSEAKIIDEIPYKEIIDYLNEKAKTNYRSTSESTKKHIRARFNEGYTIEDFKYVIEIKTKEWLKTDMEKYLRPETLFGSKFENYLNQKTKKENVPSWFNQEIKKEEGMSDEEVERAIRELEEQK